MPTECTDIGINFTQFTDLTHEEVEDIVEEMNGENMRKIMEIRQDIFDDAHGNSKIAQKWQKKYYDIRNATKQVLEIGDIVVKEIKKNSQKVGRLKKKIEKEFFVVEEILENGNIQLWKTEPEDKTFPLQQLKKVYLEEMKMQDLCNDRELSHMEECTSIHVFCRTAKFAFIKSSTDSKRSIWIYQEYHKKHHI